jgi:succinate dehydrogenase / fumarate reductase cytochrome b subunit
MNALSTLWHSSVGKKLVMALTGSVLFLFAIGHMIGNLQVYLGPATLQAYADFLRHFGHGGGLWVARAVMLLCATLHVWCATELTLASWAARPVGYRQTHSLESTLSSRTMRWTGVLLFVFITYHLMHLTIGWSAVHSSFQAHDVYHNFVAGFARWSASAAYIAAMLCLGLHLYHGVWSLLQTLGLNHPRYNHLRHAFATFVAVAVVVGNISFPVAVLAGFIAEAPKLAAQAPSAPR